MMLDQLAQFALKHEQALSIAGGVWFAISCAVTARFIPIPEILEIPYVTDRNSWATSGVCNTVWWGFLVPALESRKTALRAKDEPVSALSDESD